MADGLARKKRIRAGHRGSATRILNQLDTLVAAEETDLARLAQLRLSLEEKLETLKLLDSEILDLTEDDLEEEIQQADTFKDGIYSAMVKMDRLKDVPDAASAAAREPRTAAPPTHDRDNRIKLPKLSMQPFSGDVATWTSFWDSYNSAIHQNSSLTDVDKFNYLRSLLKGTAREAVSGLMLTTANYAQAIELLTKRFGNKQQIISRHMDLLMNVESVSSHGNVKGLRRLYDLIESNVRSLKSLGVPADSYGSLLASVLMNKLPNELQLIICRKIGEADWELEFILQELVREIETRERTGAVTTSSGTQPRRQFKENPTAATLLSGGSILQCCFCNRQHEAENCERVKGVDNRKQALKKMGRCFISRDCRTRTRCAVCNGKHHTSICDGAVNPSPRAPEPTTPTQPMGLNPEAPKFQPPTSSLFVGGKGTVLLQTARVQIYDPEHRERTLEVRAILDTGSQQSYATQRVKQALALKPCSQQTMSIMTFGSDKQKTQACDLVKVAVSTRDGGDQELELFTVPFICQPLTAQPIDLCASKYQHLTDLDLADSSSGEPTMDVDLLIGSNYYWDLTTGETRRGENGPVAIHTRLGWVLSGTAPSTEDQQSATSLLTTHVLRVDTSPQDSDNLEHVLRSFWELESMGVRETEDSVLDEFTQTIHFKEGRYEVTLPWRDPHPPLPDNLELSKKRLGGLLRRLKKDPEIMREYDGIIQNQLQCGIVEEVDMAASTKTGRLHYLPHHAVIRKDKATTKVRVVYDASAKTTGSSLNECLHRGPKFDQKIHDLLLRFRTFPVALAADIEKAFLMVSICEEDRDALRFLWVDDVGSSCPQTRVLRFTRVVFGVSSSPFLLNATLQYHLDQYASSCPELVSQLTKSTYVDDIISGAPDEEKAYQLYADSKAVLREGGFNLRKFVTNSSCLQQKIDEDEDYPPARSSDETYTKATLGTSQVIHSGEHKILGIRWNVATDQCFGFDEIARLAAELEPTKRQLVSVIGRFYDPVGILSPVVIRFKLLLRALCEEKQN